MNELEKRTMDFAVKVRSFVKCLPQSMSNYEDARQLIKSSGSIGANYLEANESLSKKDFQMRIKISRKEAKETIYWLRIILQSNQLNSSIYQTGESLYNEANELLKILSTIILRTKD